MNFFWNGILQWRAATTFGRGPAGDAEGAASGFAAGEGAPEEGRRAEAASAAIREMSAQVQGVQTEPGQPRQAEVRRAAGAAAEPARPDEPRRVRGTGSTLARSAPSASSTFPRRDHLELHSAVIDMDRAARLSSTPLRVPEGRPRDARAGARALGAGFPAWRWLRAGRAPGAGTRGRPLRDWLPDRHRGAIYTLPDGDCT